MSSIVFSRNQQSAGIFIDAMNDPRTQRTVDSGEVFAMIEQAFHQGRIFGSGSRMNDHAFWFVNDNDIWIFIHDFQM